MGPNALSSDWNRIFAFWRLTAFPSSVSSTREGFMAGASVAAALGSLSSFYLSSSFLASPNRLSLSCRRNLRTRIPLFGIRASSSSPPSPPKEFNITFGVGPKNADLQKPSPLESQSTPLFIPWIVRDENGNLKLQSTPPDSYIQAMALANTSAKKKKDKASAASVASLSSVPKHSKAARRFYNQNFREPQRLSKVLAAAGVASRRSCEDLIFEGRVTVNGSVCTSPQTRVDIGKDIIYVNGNRISKKLPPKLYFALNKPKGYICSSGEESKSVVSLFEEYLKSWDKRNPGSPKPRLFTVGRLDVATTGLIIVTNDGDLAQKLAHPSSNLSKEYIAAIEGSINKRHLITISEGTIIEGVPCVPDSVELMPAQPDISRPRIRIVVHDGRNHEVREILKNAGLQIHSLKRVCIGGFRLPTDLGLGKHVELKQDDLNLLMGGKFQRNA